MVIVQLRGTGNPSRSGPSPLQLGRPTRAALSVDDGGIQLHAVLLCSLGPPNGFYGRIEPPFQDPAAEHLNVSLRRRLLRVDSPYCMLKEVQAGRDMAEEEQGGSREERVNWRLVGVSHLVEGEAEGRERTPQRFGEGIRARFQDFVCPLQAMQLDG